MTGIEQQLCVCWWSQSLHLGNEQWFKSRALGMGMVHYFFCITIVVTDYNVTFIIKMRT